jgi:hypothetical protein
MVAGFPLGPVMEGAGLNITVMSYRGVLNWGLMACRETVTGADALAAAIPEALDELLAAAGLPAGSPVGIAPGPPTKKHSPAPKARSAKSRPSKASSLKSAKSASSKASSSMAEPPVAKPAKVDPVVPHELVPDNDPVVAVIGEDTGSEPSGNDEAGAAPGSAEAKRSWLGEGPPAVDTVADLLEESGPVPVPARVTAADRERTDLSERGSPGSSNGSS